MALSHLVSLLVVCGMIGYGVAGPPRWYELTGNYSFEHYQEHFAKNYTSVEERQMRATLFAARLKEVLTHNAAGTSSYKKGVNHFMDWTDDELSRMHGGRVLQMLPVIERIRAKPHVKAHVSSKRPRPSTVDYRNAVPSVLTAVKNQGGCGSCWAHASVETLESHWAAATGDLWVLSQQQLTSCAPNPNDCGGVGGCGGSIAELAWDYVAQAGGLAEEWTYSYTSGITGENGTCKQGFTTTPVRVSGFTSIPSNSYEDVLDALAHVGTLAVNVDASGWPSYESGIYDQCGFPRHNITINHVVQLVGYGTDNGKDYWIIRNSWSPAWGEHGYMRLARATNGGAPYCGWVDHPEQGTGCNGGPTTVWACGDCGVLYDALYPNIKTA